MAAAAAGLALLAAFAPPAADPDPDADARTSEAPAAARAIPPAAPRASTGTGTRAIAVDGTVLARGSRDPLVGAVISADGAPAATSDEAGRFTLLLDPGPHLVHIQQPGFETLTAPLLLPRPTTAPWLLRLVPQEGGPRYETVVRAPSAEAPRISLEREELTTTAGSFGDPFRVIESLPGVAPIVWPLPVYAIRGANPGNTGFFVDGLRVPALFHFALGPAVIHPYFLEGLDFYAGGYPARFGRAVAGVVSASTAPPPEDRLRGSIDARLFDVGGIVSSPIDQGRGTVALAGRYAYPGAVLGALQDQVTMQYWDYQLRVDHSLGPGRLTLFAFGSYDLLEPKTAEVSSGSPDVPRTALTFHRADLRWRGGLGAGRLRLGVGAGLDRTTAPFEMSRVSVDSKSVLARAAYERGLGERADLEVGADGELQRYDTRLGSEGPSLAGFARPRTVRLAGLYTSLVWRPRPGLILTPAFRLDAYDESDTRALAPSPRLQIRLQVARAAWLKASGGRFTQMPSLPLQLPGFDGFGLAQLGLQTAWQGALGAEVGLPWAVALDASGFVHRYRLTDIRDPELGDPLLDDFLTQRDALSYGVELLLRRPPSQRLHGWISYTLSRSLRAFEGGVTAPADWDARHVLNLVLSYRLGRYTVGGRFHLHTGRPVKVGNTIPPDYARLPPFAQVDLRADRRFLFDSFALFVYLEVVNASFTDQVIGLRRTAAGIERESFRVVLPSLGLRAEL